MVLDTFTLWVSLRYTTYVIRFLTLFSTLYVSLRFTIPDVIYLLCYIKIITLYGFLRYVLFFYTDLYVIYLLRYMYPYVIRFFKLYIFYAIHLALYIIDVTRFLT